MKNLTTTEKIQNILKSSGARPTVKEALFSLIIHGFARTSKATGSGKWSGTEEYSAETVAAAMHIGMVVVASNDAPRGGKSGSLVSLVDDKRKNKVFRALAAELKAEDEAAITSRKAEVIKRKTEMSESVKSLTTGDLTAWRKLDRQHRHPAPFWVHEAKISSGLGWRSFIKNI